MNVKPLTGTLNGEQIVGIFPPLSPIAQTVWTRRLNLYTGRALTAEALETEQGERTGRLSTRSQMVSAGVISGLEIALDVEPARPGHEEVHLLHVAAGYGLTANGEDVIIATDMPIRLLALSVYAPTSILRPDEPPEKHDVGALESRSMGPTLGTLINPPSGAPAAVPKVGIIVLQPVVAELAGAFDPDDPCEEDPQNYAFEDWQFADGCRLVYYAWPEDWLALPARPAAPQDKMWRNLLAYTIFERERLNEPGEIMPWEELGVPIGLVAFDDDWKPLFVDRHAVVRAGGKPIRRSTLLPDIGNAFLAQAQMEQLAEHLTDPDLASVPIEKASDELFRYLPPAGLIPRDAIDLAGAKVESKFFPPNFGVDAVPVPLEQLDVALEMSAALVPFDTTAEDYVRILVPVPMQWYEPRLLLTEVIDPRFDLLIACFRARRQRLIKRRIELHDKANTLVNALNGSVLTFADDLGEEEKTEAAAADLPIPAGDEYTQYVIDDVLRDPEQEYGTQLPAGSTTRIIPAVNALYDAIKALVPASEHTIFIKLTLEKMLTTMTERADRADDVIDFGFLRARADIYRLRQIILGTEKSTQLAVSPALAEIIKSENSAIATKEDLRDFLTTIKGSRQTLVAPSMRLLSPDLVENAAGEIGVAGAAGLEAAAVPKFNEVSELAGITVATPFAASLISPISPIISVIPKVDLPQKSVVASITEAFQPISPFSRPPTKDHVIGKEPVVGLPDLRSTTVATRLDTAPYQEARTTSMANSAEILAGLSEEPIAGMFADLIVPFISSYEVQTGKIVRNKATTIKSLKEQGFDPIYKTPAFREDEVGHFTTGVDLVDQTIATLRLAEGRVANYRQAIDLVKKTIDDVRGNVGEIDRRLKVIDDELAEARHDVTVSRALKDEEQNRLDAINARREKIVAEQVPYLAYQRTRMIDSLLETPMRNVDPGPTRSTVPACLAEDTVVPTELRAMVDLFRDVPVRWLVQMPRLLDKLDRADAQLETIRTAKVRAAVATRSTDALVAKVSANSLLGQAISTTFMAQQQVVSNFKANVAQIDVSYLATQTWKQTRDFMSDAVTLGDLIEAGHGRTDIAQSASRELNDMAEVAACLYHAFGEVQPILRLQWAEILSQYDESISLRTLTSLPEWGDIPVLDRRGMQEKVDWLFNVVDVSVPQAVSMVNDVIRVCILLASHAPVNQLIRGRLTRKTKIQPGVLFPILADLSKVQIGMNVLMYDKVDKSKIVARAVVDDLAGGSVAARVVQSIAADMELDQDSMVDFAAADSRMVVAKTLKFAK